MLQTKIKMQDFPVGKCRLAYAFAKYCHKEAYEELKKKCLSFVSVIEDAENHARWHKESAENQLKNEIREDN